MKRSLGACGFRVLTAADADEAVAVAACHPLAFILTEEELPTFTVLLEHARAHPALKGLPVVIINPDAEEGTRYADAVVLTDYEQLKWLPLSPENVQRFS
jgi:DNA-binding response OmpR family regulator